MNYYFNTVAHISQKYQNPFSHWDLGIKSQLLMAQKKLLMDPSEL